MRRLVPIATLVALTVLTGCSTVLEDFNQNARCAPLDPSRNAPMNYCDADEGAAALALYASQSPLVTLHDLGESSDGDTRQLAVKISLDPSRENDAIRNAVLVECGMHPDEWYASESCYWLIHHLATNAADPAVQSVLDQVDVWVLPQSNPAGRRLDDQHAGDPAHYLGRRGNVHATCAAGVNLARNFSVGWMERDCPDGATSGNFAGAAPFSEVESLNLRRFVHNHMIGSVVIIHTFGQLIGSPWRADSVAVERNIAQALAINLDGHGAPANTSPTTALRRKQGDFIGRGQFVDWLTRPTESAAATVPEPDRGTMRGISTYFFEFPPRQANYDSAHFAGLPLRHGPADGSGRKHPSGRGLVPLWKETLLPVMLYLLRQGGSPQCPLDALGQRIVEHCAWKSLGLVGAKLGDALDEPGLLDFDPVSRGELLPAGERSIFVAVQNFSRNASVTTMPLLVTVTRDPGGPAEFSERALEADALDVVPGERRVLEVPYTFLPGREYEVDISINPAADDFEPDNRKVFRFRTPP